MSCPKYGKYGNFAWRSPTICKKDDSELG